MNIKQILENHALWLKGDGGERADLRHADLNGADLRHADLRHAYLYGAYLYGADLSGAVLRHADLSYAVLSYAVLRHADLSGAGLYGANLYGADLSGANLSGAVLWLSIGNMREIKTIAVDTWTITYTADVMQIGCNRHKISEWFEFTDEQIHKMDRDALEWWKKYKQFIQLAIELSPAEPAGAES